MTRLLCFSALALCLTVVSVHALTVEIPLPGLLGTYPAPSGNYGRSAAFALPAAPSVIHGTSLRLTGTVAQGILDCDGTQVSWHAEVAAYLFDVAYAGWSAWAYPVGDGPFLSTAPFSTSSGATWAFLMDGSGQIEMYAGGRGTWCSGVVETTVTITEAVLIVDAEFPVAVEPSTWGKIKALYR
jgi:hypothetical protein